MIKDEFSSNRKLSRQRIWQLRRRKEGRCVICGEPAITVNYCLKHVIWQREYQRKRLGSKKRIRSLSYELEKNNGKHLAS